MAETEGRTFYEGELRWVQASGTGVWATASAAATGLIGYVRAGMNTTETFRYATVMDRGMPKHHKFQGKDPVEVTFDVIYGITANYPNPATASGMSVKAVHLELKSRTDEWTTASGLYMQWMGAVLLSRRFSEAEDGDTVSFTYRALNCSAFMGSGYIA
jgi:hypothetical protein